MSLVKEPTLHAIDTLDDLDAVVCLVPDDQRPLQGAAGFVDWRLCGALSRALVSGFFHGAPGEKLLMPSEERIAPARVFVVGLGATKNVTALGLEHALGASVAMLEKVKAEHVVVALPPLAHLDQASLGAAVGRGLVSKWKAGRVVVLADPALEASIPR
jgi:hypothetical protein